jgi:hydrogenase nickel incorporation protein HypA/HybF
MVKCITYYYAIQILSNHLPLPFCSPIMKSGERYRHQVPPITMHEYSITESLLKLALEKAGEAGAAKITRINLIIGEMSGVVGDCVQFYFEAISKDTIANGAQLEFKTIPTTVRCRKCNNIFTPRDSDWSCPDCHENGIDIVSGRECHMESIEVE